MIQPTRIPLGHLYSSGVQPNHVYSPEEDELISLLGDKEGYIQKKQYDEIGKIMADIKEPELLPKIQPKALARIEKYKQDLMDLYKGQRDRRKLSEANLLKADQMKRELKFDLSTLGQLKVDFDKETHKLAEYLGRQLLTTDEAAEIESEFYAKAADPNVGFADVPFYSQMLAQKVAPREREQKVKAQAEQEKQFNDRLFGLYKQWNFTEGGTKGRNDASVRQNIEASHPSGSTQWQMLDDELAQRNFYPEGVITEADKKSYLTRISKSGYNPSEASRGSMNITNTFGGKDKYKLKPIKQGDFTYFNFSGKPVSDIYGEYSGKYTTIKRDDKTNELQVFLSQVVNSKNEPIDLDSREGLYFMETTGAKRDPNKAGGVWLPYNEAVEGALQMNDIDTEVVSGKPGAYTPPGSKTAKPADKSSVKVKWYQFKDSKGNWRDVTKAFIEQYGIDLDAAIKSGDIKEK